MVDMFNLVVNYLIVELFLDVIDSLVTKGLSDVVVIYDTSVAVVSSSISTPISVTGVTL